MTAVEWFSNKIDDLVPFISDSKSKIFLELTEQAKEMERQQIEDAANWNGYFDNPKPGTLTGEQYYNETYK